MSVSEFQASPIHLVQVHYLSYDPKVLLGAGSAASEGRQKCSFLLFRLFILTAKKKKNLPCI